MNRYIEFAYETLKGSTLEVQGKTDGSVVEFIAYNNNGGVVDKINLTTLDVRNIEEFILDNTEPELEYYDLDYRDER